MTSLDPFLRTISEHGISLITKGSGGKASSTSNASGMFHVIHCESPHRAIREIERLLSVSGSEFRDAFTRGLKIWLEHNMIAALHPIDTSPPLLLLADENGNIAGVNQSHVTQAGSLRPAAHSSTSSHFQDTFIKLLLRVEKLQMPLFEFLVDRIIYYAMQQSTDIGNRGQQSFPTRGKDEQDSYYQSGSDLAVTILKCIRWVDVTFNPTHLLELLTRDATLLSLPNSIQIEIITSLPGLSSSR